MPLPPPEVILQILQYFTPPELLHLVNPQDHPLRSYAIAALKLNYSFDLRAKPQTSAFRWQLKIWRLEQRILQCPNDRPRDAPIREHLRNLSNHFVHRLRYRVNHAKPDARQQVYYDDVENMAFAIVENALKTNAIGIRYYGILPHVIDHTLLASRNPWLAGLNISMPHNVTFSPVLPVLWEIVVVTWWQLVSAALPQFDNLARRESMRFDESHETATYRQRAADLDLQPSHLLRLCAFFAPLYANQQTLHNPFFYHLIEQFAEISHLLLVPTEEQELLSACLFLAGLSTRDIFSQYFGPYVAEYYEMLGRFLKEQGPKLGRGAYAFLEVSSQQSQPVTC
ncbi:hypothetical protein BC938DRAFT_470921 [Jimgerdemannia flammicorona]|uniref:F-box domain-containing protein n=1 Tax=Jimgerdemannia flammicorona TaxID=994334 RepID=A0A433Q960_9FUNG|nr:hypothetical protein BC938DRAFT_470921 [Jimgerdemannia flammicorona]